MASFNKVILMGNLTRDPELRYTPKGSPVAKFGLAINRYWTSETGEKKEEVTFIDIEAWNKTAENISQYMRKGSPLMVEGRLRMDSWEDKTTQQKRTRLVVVAETAQFIGSPRTEGGAPAEPRPARPAAPARPASAAEPPPHEEVPGPEDDDVPF